MDFQTNAFRADPNVAIANMLLNEFIHLYSCRRISKMLPINPLERRVDQKRQFLQLGAMFLHIDELTHRKKRTICMDADNRARTTTTIQSFATYKRSAEKGKDANFRRFIRLSLQEFNELLARVATRIEHGKITAILFPPRHASC